jgi:type IV pilus assembly protein PilE
MYSNSSSDERDIAGNHDSGFTLIEILIAIVLVGILSAVAVVGISNLVGKGSKSSCQASADASKAASAVYFTTNARYPANFLELTAPGTTGAPLALPVGVTPAPILATTLVVNSGTSWVLTMTPGASGAAPTFGCT